MTFVTKKIRSLLSRVEEAKRASSKREKAAAMRFAQLKNAVVWFDNDTFSSEMIMIDLTYQTENSGMGGLLTFPIPHPTI